jgi:hypothetical protein
VTTKNVISCPSRFLYSAASFRDLRRLRIERARGDHAIDRIAAGLQRFRGDRRLTLPTKSFGELPALGFLHEIDGAERGAITNTRSGFAGEAR